jgi:signal transduction histidine kinase
VKFGGEDLRPLSIFHELSERELDWFCEHGERIELAAGKRMFERGEPATALWVVVEGVIKGFEEVGGQWLLVATTSAGETTGMLPFSRMTHYPRHAIADGPSVVLRLDVAHFRELLDVSEEVVRRLVAQMSDRVRGDVRLEQQGEKMMALGRLSAGLAHELNNPAAAIQRASAKLLEHRADLPRLVLALSGSRLDEPSLRRIQDLRRVAGPGGGSPISAIERSGWEEEISDWLEDRGVGEAWELAATFAESGIAVGDLGAVAERVPDEALGDLLGWLAAGFEADRMVMEINTAAGRISELISSVKTYSHMDRSTEHKPTDVRAGVDNTLTMLGHKLRDKKIQLTRRYQEDLPLIPAHEGELNQVWTNLIDNAIDAMDEGGELILKARENDMWVEVEVVDDGPGIADEVRRRMFEPFFTTKEVGIGTGLGLGIAQRIVRTHQGHIEVRSEPGETVMCVRLPVTRTSPAEPSGRGQGSDAH